jgi:O-antigen/teichoic acid export membrane protein
MWTIFKAGLPFGIINLINSLYFRFLPDYFGHLALTETQFATFNLSFRIAQIVSLFSTFLMFSALPGIREYIDQKHWQKVRLLYSRIVLTMVISGGIVVIFGSLL